MTRRDWYSGLASVSIHSSFVLPGRTAALHRRRVVHGDQLDLQPPIAWRNPSASRAARQYITFGASTWSPGASACNTAVAATMPEANSAARSPPLARRRAPRGGAACTPAAPPTMPEANRPARSPPSSAHSTASAWSKAGLPGRAWAGPERYWLSGSRREVDETWIGGVIARVLSSTQPSARSPTVPGRRVLGSEHGRLG